MITQDDTHPTVSTVNTSDMTIHTLTQMDGSRAHFFDPPPRLHPRGWYQRRCAAPQSTDPSLAQIHRGERPNPVNDAMTSRSRRQTDHFWISDKGEQRRRAFFLIIAIASILPFISPIALCGGFDTALQWHTKGEADRFTRRQMRFLFVEMMVSVIVLTAVVVFVVLRFGAHH